MDDDESMIINLELMKKEGLMQPCGVKVISPRPSPRVVKECGYQLHDSVDESYYNQQPTLVISSLSKFKTIQGSTIKYS